MASASQPPTPTSPLEPPGETAIDPLRAPSEETALEAAGPETLAFDVVEGSIRNRFFRRGPVAAHVLATSGACPRILVAFPAGNTGVGLWFDRLRGSAEVTFDAPLRPIERADGMHGVEARIAIRATEPLRIRDVTLGSLRMVRNYAHKKTVPERMAATVSREPTLVARRTMLDGVPVELALDADGGTLEQHDGALAVARAEGGIVRLRLTALTGARPLTPIESRALVSDAGGFGVRDLRALAFLAYEEKLLAGSWRFLTYFGRDTLLSLRLLMPALRPSVIEAALGSVLDRSNADGEIAHEEELGEWATWIRQRNGDASAGAEPIFDYKMVDDDFLLAPVLAHYVFDTEAGWSNLEAFLARRTPNGNSYAEVVRANLDLVLRRARPFGDRPEPATLVALREGQGVGEWRDSLEGLGRGRIPYSVNAALVPAALAAAERLYASALFGPGSAELAQDAARLGRAWTRASAFFDVAVERDDARERVRAYAAEIGLDPEETAATIEGDVRFPALALDDRGRTIAIQHSDDGFALLFTNPSPTALLDATERILRPFPVGLRTPVGLVVANPAYALDPALRGLFTTAHYHGTVVWSWQHALLAAGLERQLARRDLPEAVRTALGAAQAMLWQVIDATRATSTTELWSFAIEDGRFRLVPFGQGRGDADESNAAQLWSTVYLGVRRPPR